MPSAARFPSRAVDVCIQARIWAASSLRSTSSFTAHVDEGAAITATASSSAGAAQGSRSGSCARRMTGLVKRPCIPLGGLSDLAAPA